MLMSRERHEYYTPHSLFNSMINFKKLNNLILHLKSHSRRIISPITAALRLRLASPWAVGVTGSTIGTWSVPFSSSFALTSIGMRCCTTLRR